MGNKIKAARQSLGLTQLQFADKAKIPLRTYKKYEADESSNDRRIPDAVTAIRIAKSLDTTVEMLWGDSPVRAF